MRKTPGSIEAWHYWKAATVLEKYAGLRLVQLGSGQVDGEAAVHIMEVFRQKMQSVRVTITCWARGLDTSDFPENVRVHNTYPEGDVTPPSSPQARG